MKRSRIIVAVAVAVVGAIVFSALGVELSFSIAWAVLAGILVLCTQLVVPEDPRMDAPEIGAQPERRGTEISRMAWSLNPSTGLAGELITRRVRAILAHRLQRHGLDVTNPDHAGPIAALAGVGVWERLIGHGTTRQELDKALDAIDRLSPSGLSQNPSGPSQNPTSPSSNKEQQ